MHHFLLSLADGLLAHLDWLLFGVLLLLACMAPRLGHRWFSAAERVGARFAERKSLAIAVLAFVAIAARVSLLAWDTDPVPTPLYHDEFSYLLAADTFTHGRLTNPPHPLPIFFETFHVLQRPTYMSKFPPAQGAVLALGQVLGHPWIGVVLSVGAMCAAILWMLQGWLPARWALLGGVLVLLRIGLFNDWVDSYWGGAAAAIGGALVVGALPRILRRQRPRDALMMGLGAAILANSRPLEGLVLFATVVVALILWFFGRRVVSTGPSGFVGRRLATACGRGIALRRVVVPFGAVLFLAASFIAYYNWRGTHNPLRFPYAVYEQTYDTSPLFLWQSARPPLKYNNPQFDAFYNVWAPAQFSDFLDDGWINIRDKIAEFIGFFAGKELLVALLALPWMLRDRRVRFLRWQFLVCGLGLLSAVWFWPHYAAPLAATTTALLIQGLRHVRQWRVRGWPVGLGLSRAVVLLTFTLVLLQVVQSAPNPFAADSGWDALAERGRYVAELAAKPGLHLVIVRYSLDHNPHIEWVYNGADLDRAKVVWAREIPGVDMRPLLDYYHDRQIWLLEPDAAPPLEFTPYSLPAAGLSSSGPH
jgi:hypothetical protein